MGYAHVPLVTLEINVKHLVNVIQMGLLTKTVMLMGDAPVPMATLEINVVHVQMDTARTFQGHVLNVRIFEDRIFTST